MKHAAIMTLMWATLMVGETAGSGTADISIHRLESPAALYGISGPGPVGLVRVSPATLQPLPGRRVPLDAHTFGWSFSPDGSRIALASDTPRAELRVIDLRQMRVLGDVKVARRGSVFATRWAGASRILAVVVTPGCCGRGDTIVAGVDAATRHVLWRRMLGGALQAGERFRRSLVLALGPRGRSIGPSRLALVRPDGQVRSVPLPEIRSGSQTSGGSDPARFLVREWNPGLAVDPSGARAFVVQAEAPVAEVDLRTLRVRSHPLSQPVSLLDRLHDWLEPTARAKTQQGPARQALWLGHGLLAVTGTDTHASFDVPGRPAQWSTPAGLKLIDTHRWSIRTIDERASSAAFVSDTLLASSLLWDSRQQTISGSGLTGYALDGSRRFHLYGDDPISGVQPVGERVLVSGAAGSRLFRLGALVDGRTGRELRRVRLDLSLIAGDQPFWY